MDNSEKREFLNILFLNSELDTGIVDFKYKQPFDMLADCVRSENWLPRSDSNQRPSG